MGWWLCLSDHRLVQRGGAWFNGSLLGSVGFWRWLPKISVGWRHRSAFGLYEVMVVREWSPVDSERGSSFSGSTVGSLGFWWWLLRVSTGWRRHSGFL